MGSLPVTQPGPGPSQPTTALRRRLSSLHLPLPSPPSTWPHFPRSTCTATSSIKLWWEWGWAWLMARKLGFTDDLEMNEDEVRALVGERKGILSHVVFRVRRMLWKSHHHGGLPF